MIPTLVGCYSVNDATQFRDPDITLDLVGVFRLIAVKNMKYISLRTFSVLLFCAVLSGCGIKQKAIDLKERITSFRSSDSGPEITGMLQIIDPDKCPIASGCGPTYSLLGVNLKKQIAIEGEIQNNHNQLIITAQGEFRNVTNQEKNKSGYENVHSVLKVKEYRIRSRYPYQTFLDTKVSQKMEESFGCEPLWDKSYSWSVENEKTVLSVKLAETLESSTSNFIQFFFDGNTGDFLDQIQSGKQPCS